MPRSGIQTVRRRLSILVPAILAAGMLALGGCAQRPPAAWTLTGAQPVLDSAQHWRVVADDVGSAISTHLVNTTGNKEPVSVFMTRGANSLFADAFLNAVTTRLVGHGHAVAVEPRPDVVAVGIDMLIVPFSPRRDNQTAPGGFTILGTGAAVTNLMLDSFPWGVTAIALGYGLDTVLARPQETDTEMVLTVSMVRDGFYNFRASASYYINRRDLWHYQDDPMLLPLRTFNDVPAVAIGYDLGGKPYVMRR